MTILLEILVRTKNGHIAGRFHSKNLAPVGLDSVSSGRAQPESGPNDLDGKSECGDSVEVGSSPDQPNEVHPMASLPTTTPAAVVTLRATYSEDWFDDECGECGSVVTFEPATAANDYRAGWVCPVDGAIPDKQVNPASDPCEQGGYTEVHNPWGGHKVPVPDGLCGDPFATWRDEHVAAVTVTIEEAAEIVADFPGAVWDYRDDCDAEQDNETGHYTRVTLHVDDEHEEAVFARADEIESGHRDGHVWGPVERARLSGNPHRKCQNPGCSVITLDLSDCDDDDCDGECGA